MPVIRLDGVSFRYRGATELALSEITCHIRPGELVGLLGRSGSGRSTLASTLNGTIPHLVRGEMRGQVSIGGQDIRTCRPRDLADRVGFVFQDFEAQLFSTNVALEVAFGPENLGVPREEISRRVDRYLRLVRLEALRHKAPASLSGGQKQRLALASVLALEPQVLVLDEPTSDLDPAGRQDLWDAVRDLRRERALTLVIIDPETDEMGWVDRFIVLDRGRVVLSGTPSELRHTTEMLEGLGVKGFTLAKLASALGHQDEWQDADQAATAIRSAGWRVNEGAVENLRRADVARTSGEVLLEVEDLTHRYPDGTEALSGVSCAIRRGEFVAILGQNGSGKTTLAKHLNGILTPTIGDIRLSGRSLRGQSPIRLSRLVGLVFQNPDDQLFSPTVFEDVAFGPLHMGLPEADVRTRVDMALEAVRMSAYRDRLSHHLSVGEKKRIAIATVLSMNPSILILDEPSSGLDPRARRTLIHLLHELPITMLISTHDMAMVKELFPRTIVMDEGQIVADGLTKEILEDEKLLEAHGLEKP